MYVIIRDCFLLGNIIQKTQSISPARKSLLPLSLSLFMIFLENHKSVPAQVSRGFLNNITSHFFRMLTGFKEVKGVLR
jgi:hypothetical protein